VIAWGVAAVLAVALAWLWVTAKRERRELVRVQEETRAERDLIERALTQDLEAVRADLARCRNEVKRQEDWRARNR